MPNEHMLSERAKRLVKKAKQRMNGMRLNVHPSRLPRVRSQALRKTGDSGKWVHVDLKVDKEYVANGGEETDYILAHELGHAVRIASGKEPVSAAEIWEHVQAEEMDPSQANVYINREERSVRDLLYREEEVAWDIAGTLLADIGDPAKTLADTRKKSLQTYREGWRLD